MLRSYQRSRQFLSCGDSRRHKLAVEPLEHRLLLAADLEFSSYLDASFAYATAVDGDAVYVQLPDSVVKLVPNPAFEPGVDDRLYKLADGWVSPTWGSIPVGGDIAVVGGSVYVTGQGGAPFEHLPALCDPACDPLQATSADTLRDVYIVKLDAGSGAVQYFTFLGGNKIDTGRGIAVDDNRNIYVTGSTGSDNSFPKLEAGYEAPPASGDNEIFVAALTPRVDDVVNYDLGYLELFGGSNSDSGRDIALMNCPAAGPNAGLCDVVVTGNTMSSEFADDIELDAYVKKQDIFVMKVTPIEGEDSLPDPSRPGVSGLSYGDGRVIGGKFDDLGRGVAVSGDLVYVAGTTGSSNLPIPGPSQGGTDAVVIKLNSETWQIDPSSRYLGGSNNDRGYDVAVDSAGNVHVTGGTQSSDFPGVSNSLTGNEDAFIVKLNDDLTENPVDQTGRYLGGSQADVAWGIAVDSDGNSYVTGRTDSDVDFPLLNAFDDSFDVFGSGAPFYNAFVAKVSYADPVPVPGITVTPTSGLETTEAPGGTDTFTVVLDTLPSASVSIDLSSSDPSEGELDGATSNILTLTFDTLNWDQAQTVTVRGVDDSDLDGDVAYTINTAQADSIDEDYGAIDPDDVSVTNLDDEATAGVTVTGIIPDFMPGGTTIELVMTGAGFQDGAEVSFQGCPKPPTASNVTFVDSNKLTALVTARAHKSPRYCDVVVTVGSSSGTLENGLQITAASLQASADFVDDGPGPGNMLTEAMLGPAVQEAVGLWAAAGVDSQRLAELNQVDVRIADLDGALLGSASAGTLLIDRDAAGYGWSVDLDASQSPHLAGIDLLSAVVHELGHVLGVDHDVMGATLGVGVRDLDYLDDVFSETGSWTQIRQPGDANGDGRFDQLDLVAVLQAGKYRTGQAADPNQGDFNGDGLFDQLDLVAALQAGNYDAATDVDELFARG